MVLALVSTMDSITSFSLAVHHRDRNRFFVNVHADILLNIHTGAPSGRVLDHTQTLLQRGALL